jgi:large subunit ribosomal protein L3
MAGFIIGQKDIQTQTFNEKGNLIPVTKIFTSPCFLIDINWPETKGYASVKLGFGVAKRNLKPVKGQLEKAGIQTPLRFLKEIRIKHLSKDMQLIEEEGKKGLLVGEQKLFIGQEMKPEMLFKLGDIIDVVGTSKGKGFQGVVKRHGFRGGPATHGQSDRERAPGSLGSGTTPGRVFKGLRMAGRMGGDRVTVQNLQVVGLEDQAILVKGLVPGAKSGFVEVKTHGL